MTAFYRPCTVALCDLPAEHVYYRSRRSLYFCDPHWWKVLPSLTRFWFR